MYDGASKSEGTIPSVRKVRGGDFPIPGSDAYVCKRTGHS